MGIFESFVRRTFAVAIAILIIAVVFGIGHMSVALDLSIGTKAWFSFGVVVLIFTGMILIEFILNPDYYHHQNPPRKIKTTPTLQNNKPITTTPKSHNRRVATRLPK